MRIVQVKPTSVNECYSGRRSTTQKYKQYKKDVRKQLKPMKLPEPPFRVNYEFGFSSRGSDIDNYIKNFQDILQKKYKFNDNQIYEMFVKKKIVKKGSEYIKFEILALETPINTREMKLI